MITKNHYKSYLNGLLEKDSPSQRNFKLSTRNVTHEEGLKAYRMFVNPRSYPAKELHIEQFIEAYKKLDGIQVIGTNHEYNPELIRIEGWAKETEDLFREFYYVVLQDYHWTDRYFNNYECFLNEWNTGEIEPWQRIIENKEEFYFLKSNVR